MGVSKQATEKVNGRSWLSSSMFSGSLAATVITWVMGHFRVCGGCGPILGTVPLAHKVADPQHGRMVDQVSAADFGIAVGAGRISTQSFAEFQVKAINGRVQVRSE